MGSRRNYWPKVQYRLDRRPWQQLCARPKFWQATVKLDHSHLVGNRSVNFSRCSKALRGDTALPIVRIELSQKVQSGVHLTDLAAYIDKRRAAALKEYRQLAGEFRTKRVRHTGQKLRDHRFFLPHSSYHQIFNLRFRCDTRHQLEQQFQK